MAFLPVSSSDKQQIVWFDIKYKWEVCYSLGHENHGHMMVLDNLFKVVV